MKQAKPIPERRPSETERNRVGPDEGFVTSKDATGISGLRYPVWRCTVCGYLCAREEPPLVCPICKAKKDRFERFI